MMSCSSLYTPFRWLRRDPLLGHRPMRPARVGKDQLEICCVECLRTWPVAATFPPSPTFLHRQWLARWKGIGNVIGFRKRAA
jgi:hypothetical protein